MKHPAFKLCLSVLSQFLSLDHYIIIFFYSKLINILKLEFNFPITYLLIFNSFCSPLLKKVYLLHLHFIPLVSHWGSHLTHLNYCQISRKFKKLPHPLHILPYYLPLRYPLVDLYSNMDHRLCRLQSQLPDLPIHSFLHYFFGHLHRVHQGYPL